VSGVSRTIVAARSSAWVDLETAAGRIFPVAPFTDLGPQHLSKHFREEVTNLWVRGRYRRQRAAARPDLEVITFPFDAHALGHAFELPEEPGRPALGVPLAEFAN